MTLEDALSYIHRVDWRDSIPGLSRIDTLLGMLGHPERAVKYIHITGTNGKGSTCAMLAAILRQAGYKTGLYTSPYIFRFNERMQINGTPISDDALCALVGFAADLIGCLFSPFGYNPIFCLPPILYGLWAGLLRRYVWRRPTVWRVALAVFPAAALGSVLWQSMALALVYGGAARWPYFLTRLAARSVQFAVTGCIDTVLVWLLARRNALSPVLRRIKTKGSEHRDA